MVSMGWELMLKDEPKKEGRRYHPALLSLKTPRAAPQLGLDSPRKAGAQPGVFIARTECSRLPARNYTRVMRRSQAPDTGSGPAGPRSPQAPLLYSPQVQRG